MYKYKTASTKPNSGTCQEKGLMKVKKKKKPLCYNALLHTGNMLEEQEVQM